MNYFSYKSSLHKLRRQESKLRIAYKQAVEEARKKGGWKAEQEAHVMESVDLEMVQDEIASLISDYLTSKARCMFVPIPNWAEREKGLWEKSGYTERWRLSENGVAEVYRAIVKQRKESWELVISIISLAIGLVGAVTALVAISK